MTHCAYTPIPCDLVSETRLMTEKFSLRPQNGHKPAVSCRFATTRSVVKKSPSPLVGEGFGVRGFGNRVSSEGMRDHPLTLPTPIHATLPLSALTITHTCRLHWKIADYSGQKIFPFPRKSGKIRNSSGKRESSSKYVIRAKKILLRPQNARKSRPILIHSSYNREERVFASPGLHCSDSSYIPNPQGTHESMGAHRR